MSRRVFVIGVGMTNFIKPGRPDNPDYPEMVKEAVTAALTDGKITYKEVEQACVGYVYGESTSGQRALYEVGMTGIPIFNVNNNCATGSSALLLARNMVMAGSDCVLAAGFEKMDKGSLSTAWSDRASPFEKNLEAGANKYGIDAAPFTAQMFGNAGREHMEKYGTTKEQFAKIAEKNHRHSANNPRSQFRNIHSLQDILNSKTVHEPLTKLQCCPTSDGAAAAIVVSEEFVRQKGLESQAVEILALEMATDVDECFDGSCINAVGWPMSKKAADQAYRKAGLTADDVQIIEVHDCFSANELITYEALGLCPVGKAGELVDRGDISYGGKWVVNPSGGLISKGHPLGATGLAQCAEISLQLRGLAGPRQVPNAKVGMNHNIGLGGAAVVGLYRLGFNKISSSPETPDGAKSFKSFPVFVEITETLSNKALSEELKSRINGILCFRITNSKDGNKAAWIIDFKRETPTIEWVNFEKAKGDCVLTVSDSDLLELKQGKLMPQKAFFAGRLKVSGNMALAMKIQPLLQSQDRSKL